MPLYEYHCSKCEKDFEVWHKMEDDPIAEHQGCGGPAVRKLTPSAFQFRGTGFYETDYKHK